jgi:hypothetical protein
VVLVAAIAEAANGEWVTISGMGWVLDMPVRSANSTPAVPKETAASSGKSYFPNHLLMAHYWNHGERKVTTRGGY